MEIKRVGESYDHGWTTLLAETPISQLKFDQEGNLEIFFDRVKLPSDRKTYHVYRIALTPDDLGKIFAEAIKKGITKSK